VLSSRLFARLASLRLSWGSAFLAGLFIPGFGGIALAQADRQVFVPVMFNADGTKIRTTACLEVTERAEPSSAWWEDTSATTAAPERAFKEVLAAIKRKDGPALARLSDPTQGEGTKDFASQSAALFQQFEIAKIIAVPKAYALDGLLVFFARLQFGSMSAYVPFVFARGDNASFGFLPAQSSQLSFQLVADWVAANSPPTEAGNWSYCEANHVARATHRLPLVPSDGAAKQVWHPSRLLFVGASFDAPGALGGPVAEVRSTIDSLKSADFGGEAQGFLSHVTEAGGDQIKKWLVTANDADRARYKKSVVAQLERPLFLIDASPLFVLYTRQRAAVQAVYFTLAGNGSLLWTNNAYVTDADRLFKRGALNEAAMQANPFAEFAIK
jgi:hypothetical protein